MAPLFPELHPPGRRVLSVPNQRSEPTLAKPRQLFQNPLLQALRHRAEHQLRFNFNNSLCLSQRIPQMAPKLLLELF
ncbi:hypothetical protein EMPG_13302 [Blastomyces silverae]|uniref:Uncharacterized protein n=1 Tax=Blastomyces silverae TaxID=2060906 RepID=A0A0H1BKF3_9EURO|nr:hypothetical protein EMPG_13302 [Blastomyces silverae]